MFITKKKFNEAIKNAKDEERRLFEQRENQISTDRSYDEMKRDYLKELWYNMNLQQNQCMEVF